MTRISAVSARYRLQATARDLSELLALADETSIPQRAFEGIRTAYEAVVDAKHVLEEVAHARP